MEQPESPSAPPLWATDSKLPDPGSSWQELDASSKAAGLVALLLDDLRDSSQPGRPWASGEFDPNREHLPDDYEPDHVFRENWWGYVPIGSLPPDEKRRVTSAFTSPSLQNLEFEEDEEETAMFLELAAPWGVQFPGLALAERTSGDRGRYDAAVHQTPSARIGLVDAVRPADVPYVIGWMGATNHFRGNNGPALLSTMMRSWEDRFGARLFRLGFDTMEFLVERPPSSEASALAIAAEHFAFAGNDAFQAGPTPVHSIRGRAELILANPTWYFWWD